MFGINNTSCNLHGENSIRRKLSNQQDPQTHHIYIYIYAGQSVWGPHLTPWVKSVRGPFLKKKLLSAERSPLSDGSGSTKSRFRGPSKFAHGFVDPEPASPWTPNRHSNWSFLDLFLHC